MNTLPKVLRDLLRLDSPFELEREYNEWRDSPFLMSSDEIREHILKADEEQLDDIATYLMRFQNSHDIFEVDAFADCYLNIIDKKESIDRRRKKISQQIRRREGIRKSLREGQSHVRSAGR